MTRVVYKRIIAYTTHCIDQWCDFYSMAVVSIKYIISCRQISHISVRYDFITRIKHNPASFVFYKCAIVDHSSRSHAVVADTNTNALVVFKL